MQVQIELNQVSRMNALKAGQPMKIERHCSAAQIHSGIICVFVCVCARMRSTGKPMHFLHKSLATSAVAILDESGPAGSGLQSGILPSMQL